MLCIVNSADVRYYKPMKNKPLSIPFKLFIAFLLVVYSVIGLLVTLFFLYGATTVSRNNGVFGFISTASFAATITMWVFYFRAVNSNSKKTMTFAAFMPAVPVLSLVVFMFLESN